MLKTHKIILVIVFIFLQINFAKGQVSTQNNLDNENVPEQDKLYSSEIAKKIKSYYLANKSKMPNKDILKNMPLNANLPQNISQELYKYDWLQVSEYDFNIVNDGYNEYTEGFKYQRESPKHGVLVFNFQNKNQPSLEYQDNNMVAVKTIQKKGQYYFYSPKENIPDNPMDYPVVDYRNGFLIIDFTASGEVNNFSERRRVRHVLMAIPKFFTTAGQMLNPTITNTNNSNNTNINNNSSTTATDDNNIYQPQEYLSKEYAQKIEDFYWANKHKILGEATLKSMKFNTNLPADINDIFSKYDFLEVANYFFHPTEPGYTLADNPISLERHHSTKGILKFQLIRSPTKSFPAELRYMDNASNSPQKIVKKGTHFYYCDKNEKKSPTYSPVVDFKDGLLIIDVTYSGALNDLSNPRRFRKVFMLVPKLF
ncbi:MAG: hypothetical protein EAZ85_00615 [Bacteroidetes bacterium]|nr:MAG: hypothetical protein EAZ85_00615 [Bacteroidota bacterium]TAG86147.1 MAG: hypothetical protein EAZ20_13360 [Bacteroidota bacterium]